MQTPLYRYVVGLGSNLGNRDELLVQARAGLERSVGTIVATAKTYRTAPVGAADLPFLNSAVVVTSPLAPREVMHLLLQIETGLGRVRSVKWGNRTIDLDLLMARLGDDQPFAYEDEVVQIPHPYLLERDFALVPAAAVAGDWLHPGSGRTLADEVVSRQFSLRE